MPQGHQRRIARAPGLRGVAFRIATQSAATEEQSAQHTRGWIPARILLADYPQLKSLAWQVQGTDALTPQEALDIYDANWRHVDVQAMNARERDLVEALRLGLGETNTQV